jgi:hypothetical protein
MLRTLLRSATWGRADRDDSGSAAGAVIVAWRTDNLLAVDPGPGARQLGQVLYVLPARVGAVGTVTFRGQTIARSVVDVQALEANDSPTGLTVRQGTMTVDYHPAGFDGTLVATGLTVLLGNERAVAGSDGPELRPLPAGQQPGPGDGTGAGPGTANGSSRAPVPVVQLYERIAGRWIEFEPLQWSRTYRIANPDRFLSATGSLLVRFIAWGPSSTEEFSFSVRIDGIAE